MRREGRGHKLGAEKTGVNRIFKGGHSPTPSVSAPPPLSDSSHSPSSTQTIPGQGLTAQAGKEKLQMLGRSRRGLLISRGIPGDKERGP